MKQIDRIAEARDALKGIDPIIFASLARLELVQDDEGLETISTDGSALGFNSGWISSLDGAQVIFAVAGIGYMIAMNFIEQRGVRPPRTWAMACGYATNDYLVTNGVGKPVNGALYDKRFVGKTASEIFETVDPEWTAQSKALGWSAIP